MKSKQSSDQLHAPLSFLTCHFDIYLALLEGSLLRTGYILEYLMNIYHQEWVGT